MQTIINAFNDFKNKKQIDFRSTYDYIFNICIRENKTVTDVQIAQFIETYIKTDIDNYYTFESLESFVQLWDYILYQCHFVTLITQYYQDVICQQGKFVKTKNLCDKLLQNKFFQIKNRFFILLTETLISEYKRNPVRRHIILKCINIVKHTKTTEEFFSQYKSSCTAWLSEEYSKFNDILKLSIETFLFVKNASEQYDISEQTIPILQNTLIIPAISQYTNSVPKFIENNDPQIIIYYKLTKYISEETTFGKLIVEDIVNNVKCDTVVSVLEKNAKYMKLLDSLEPGRYATKGISSFFFIGFQKVFTDSFSETLALYIDSLFKEKLDEQEFEEKINQVIALVCYIRDKDIFFTYYKKLFSKRLLLSRKIQQESVVLSVIKKHFGSSITHPLEIMFKDVQSTEEINKEFKEQHTTPLSVTILTQGCWPTFSLATIPVSMQTHIDLFNKFYKQKFHNRNLKFLSIGTCEIKMGKYILHTNIQQMNVLLSFNDRESRTINNIVEDTCLSTETVQSILNSLCLVKHPVLKKQGNEFVQNHSFKSKTIIVKISPGVKKETVEEKKETMKQIEEERSFKVDAAIVRVMKARKELDYNNIIIETTSALKNQFTPPPSLIKKRIETLIEREYMQRHEEKNNIFLYMA